MGRNIDSRKIPFGWVNMRAYNFFVCGPKFTIFFAPRFRLSAGRAVGEIFAIKVESCLKSRRILPSQILGGMPSPKVVPT